MAPIPKPTLNLIQKAAKAKKRDDRDLRQFAVKIEDRGVYGEYRYLLGTSISGMLSFSEGSEHYLPFHAATRSANPRLPLFRPPERLLQLCSSNAGLVLCYPYFVTNPEFPNRASRISPNAIHTADTAPRALVVTDGRIYHIVVAVPISPVIPEPYSAKCPYTDLAFPIDPKDPKKWERNIHALRRSLKPENVYAFDVYSSVTREWSYETKGNVLFSKIWENSSVGCVRYAYWLAGEKRNEKVVYYDLVERQHGIIGLPSRFRMGKGPDPEKCLFQLGIKDGNLLMLSMGAEDEIEVYSLMKRSTGQWLREYYLEFNPIQKGVALFPLRSWSGKLQAVFAVKGGVFVVENAAGETNRPANRRSHPRLRFVPADSPSSQHYLSPEVVPLVHTIVFPTKGRSHSRFG